MNNIQFSVLSYYPSIISEENIVVGILFYIEETGQRSFYSTQNLRRLSSFDDELDMDFIKSYLSGIKEDWEESLFGTGRDVSVSDFIYNFGNELRFNGVMQAKVSNVEDFINETKMMYLRYDYNKNERPSDDKIKHYMRKLLRQNSIKFSTLSVSGGFEENVNYDFVTNGYGFKSFVIEEGQDVRRNFLIYKGWSYTALKNKDKKLETVFVVDSDRMDDNYQIVCSILRENARIIRSSEVLPFVQEIKKTS